MSTVLGYLIGERGEFSGLRVAIPEKGLVIGREPKQVDVVFDHTMVSRRHAKIVPGTDGKLYLTDLQSRNGTLVNGRKVTAPVALAGGDKLDFGCEGKAVFVFESADTTSVSGVLKQAFGEKLAPPEWKPGDVIGGKYEVHGTLGKGGFGVVYLVRDRQTGRASALKTFRDEFLADGNARGAFKKEALLWVNLDEHPFILRARWVEEFSGRLFVEMDYVVPDKQGRVSLADHLAKAGGPLDLDHVLEWAIQFCLGMEHANSHGIKCHRDIKPANILIAQDGNLRIADFGLAAAAEAAGYSAACLGVSLITDSAENGLGFSLLKSGGKLRCGTPGYMPPETYRGEPADVRSDIYSFGLVLWQMASGSKVPPFLVPYRGDMEVFLRAIYDQQMAVRLPRISRPLWPVVKQCLKPAPEKRYQNFGELRNDLITIFRKKTGRSVSVPEDGVHSATFWNSKGASLHALGRYEEAIVFFDKALAISPEEARVWSNKAVALRNLGRHEEALVCYDKALEINPRYALAWSNKGECLRTLERYEEAIACGDKALEIDPREDAAWTVKGASLKALRRSEDAIGCYDKVLEMDPRKAIAWSNKGAALRDLGRLEEALVCYDKALQIDPRYLAAWYNKGNALHSLSRYEEAINCYNGALAIDPRFAVSWYGKAFSEDAADKITAAIESYRRFIELASARDTQQVAYARQRLKELET